MKNILLIIFFFAVSCNKNDRCIKAKVIRISCTGLVVQVMNKDSIGVYGWRDISGHTVYNNVFSVKNSCEIGKWAKGDEIYFIFQDSSRTSDCVICMMYDAPPGKSYRIENVSRKKCEDSPNY